MARNEVFTKILKDHADDIGKIFICRKTGLEYTLLGILADNDDYYYAMYNDKNNHPVMLETTCCKLSQFYIRKSTATVEYDDALYEAIQKLKEVSKFLDTAPLSSGVCMCGEDIDKHRMTDHPPTDSGIYNMERLMDKIDEFVERVGIKELDPVEPEAEV